ncbi:MAG: symmetrical bis(5'-nucleosyl)-tetraphosphatase [Rhodoferax sp.]|nr:symmetrical bis(5'-nucleosyl)-tetraphosphatase [Rhodoferax sp.]
MAMYLIGDIQGCDSALERLTRLIDFSPSRDTLYVLGDLVNRGPESAGVLRRLMGFGDAARCLLGNHDLHLLAVHYGVRKPARQDTLTELLHADDAPALLHWLHHQKLALLEHVGNTELLMVHAGVLPAWTAAKTIALSTEVETALQGPDAAGFFQQMYGNGPDAWDDGLQGADRRRVIVNALTRLRFCTPQGAMEFAHSGGVDAGPTGYVPWFDAPNRQTTGQVVAFGHWSTLGWLNRPNVLALDSGCVWGGCLSALRVAPAASGGLATELLQVKCAQSQAPGD